MAADGPLTVSVEPSWRRSRCGTCGKRAPRYDRQPVREWRGIVPFVVELREWRTPCFRTEVVYSTPRQPTAPSGGASASKAPTR